MRKTRLILPILMTVLLTSCTQTGAISGTGQEVTAEEEARQMRTEYLAAGFCAGSAEITADYGQRVYEFGMDFTWEKAGETVLTLTAPSDLAGLTARISEGQSRLEFDGISLDTGELTGEGLTPLELVPALMEWVQTGFMAQCTYEDLEEAPVLRVQFRDPDMQAGTGTECTVWFARTGHALLRTELYWNGELALSGRFTNFTLGEGENGDQQSPDLGGSEPGESGA